jgi:alkaline phosphatase D
MPLTRPAPRRSRTPTTARQKGRELEFADLLRFIKAANIANVVWLTADVHYTAAHFYNPEKAAFQDFEPILGIRLRPAPCRHLRPGRPRHDLRPGAEIRQSTSPRPAAKPSAFDGLQFFGVVDIDGASEAMTVHLMDRDNTELFTQTLEPKRAG